MGLSKRLSFFRYLLYLCHFILSINAVAGGFMLMLKPNGSLLQMNLNFLAGTPFTNYFIPGLLLFSFLGLPAVLSFCGLTFRFNSKILNALNLYPKKHWAWAFSIYTGIVTILWINVQLVLTEYFWLQPIISFLGLAILILTLTPEVIKHYSNNKV